MALPPDAGSVRGKARVVVTASSPRLPNSCCRYPCERWCKKRR